MPIFRSISAFEVARGIKAFLNLEVGLTRGKIPEPGDSERLRVQTQKLKNQSKVPKNSGVNPRNIIWIFGTARVGSTWLSSMMKDLEKHVRWNEPRVGQVFGNYFYSNERRQGKDVIFSPYYKETWQNSIRSFVLDGANVRFPKLGSEGYLVIKEPNGSIGAPLLMEALPESRMIFVVRDPRDVVSSMLEGAKKGNWIYMTAEEGDWSRDKDGPLSPADTDPDAFVEGLADRYLQDVGNSKQAYEAHQGRKALVRYEDLRTDTLDTMKSIYSTLEMNLDEGELSRVVASHAWENIPEERKGKGKFYRKANPGSWEEDLTPEQVQIVERITAPLLEEFYPDE